MARLFSAQAVLTGLFTFALLMLVPYNHSPLYAGLLSGLACLLAMGLVVVFRRFSGRVK